jgi:hypothetical protein
MHRLRWILGLTFALSAASISAQDLSVEPQIDRPGGDYTTFRTEDLDVCKRACARDGRCRAYTFNSVDSICYLKDRVPGRHNDSRKVSGVKGGYDDGDSRPGSGGNGGGGGLSEERGVDYRGGDYTDFRARGVDECKAECRQDRRCAAYTFNLNSRTCYLKNRVGDRQRDNDKVSGTRGGGGGYPDHPGRGGRLTQEYGVDYAGNDYSHFRARSADTCSEECRRDRRCAAYTFSQGSGVCYLKDEVGAPRRDSDKVTGIKVDR